MAPEQSLQPPKRHSGLLTRGLLSAVGVGFCLHTSPGPQAQRPARSWARRPTEIPCVPSRPRSEGSEAGTGPPRASSLLFLGLGERQNNNTSPADGPQQNFREDSCPFRTKGKNSKMLRTAPADPVTPDKRLPESCSYLSQQRPRVLASVCSVFQFPSFSKLLQASALIGCNLL